MQITKKILMAVVWLVIPTLGNAATVSCMFMSETQINTSGEWLKTETDFMKLMEMFGDGMTMKLDNSLLGQLDSGKPFLAGKINRGSVYLMGSDVGVQGKLTSVNGDVITVYDGLCDVGFGG